MGIKKKPKMYIGKQPKMACSICGADNPQYVERFEMWLCKTCESRAYDELKVKENLNQLRLI